MNLAGFRFAVVTLGASFAFAACSSVVPSPSPSAGNQQTDQGAQPQPQAANACSISTLWKFGGPCRTIALKRTGGILKLPAYKGFTTSIDFGVGPTAQVVAVHEATGKGDITGDGGKKFPPYHDTGKAFLYLALMNTGKRFTSEPAPAITVTATSAKLFPNKGLTCDYAFWFDGYWIPAIVGGVKGKTLTLSSSHTTLDIPKGVFYLAMEC